MSQILKQRVSATTVTKILDLPLALLPNKYIDAPSQHYANSDRDVSIRLFTFYLDNHTMRQYLT